MPESVRQRRRALVQKINKQLRRRRSWRADLAAAGTLATAGTAILLLEPTAPEVAAAAGVVGVVLALWTNLRQPPHHDQESTQQKSPDRQGAPVDGTARQTATDSADTPNSAGDDLTGRDQPDDGTDHRSV
jgi:hypothetical protein